MAKKNKNKINSKDNDANSEEVICNNNEKSKVSETNKSDNKENKKDTENNVEGCTEDNEQIEKIKSEYDLVNNKLLRLQADFLNYKERTTKEKFATYSDAVADVIKEILPILDNFERAILSVKETDSEEVKNFNKGISMIYEQLMNVLNKRGLTEIEALDKKFDPILHSGIATEVVDDKEEDTIIEVYQKGYTVKEKVIRPSMVKISKK